jgi:hypothetical protein
MNLLKEELIFWRTILEECVQEKVQLKGFICLKLLQIGPMFLDCEPQSKTSLINRLGKPTCTLVPWRQGFKHPTKNECMGWFAQISSTHPNFLSIITYYITASWTIVSGDATSSMRARHLILLQRPRCQSRGKRERTRLCNPYLPVFAAGAAAMQLFIAMPPPSPSSFTDDRKRRCCRINSHSYVLYPDSVAFSRIENDQV